MKKTRQSLLRPAKTALAITAATLFASGAAFAADSAAPPRTITVSGAGEVKAVPDEAHLSAGVITTANTATEALAANTRAMRAVFATLKKFGIAEEDVQTSDFSVVPQHAPNRNGEDSARISGYSVSNTVDVTVEVAKLGTALDALVSSGANSLGDIAFTMHDPKPLLATARAEAIRDAIARATTYANAGGFALGPILAVGEGGAETPRRVYAAPMMAPAAAVPVAAGQETVSANVSVTFEIR